MYALVGVHTEEPSNDLGGEYFRVGELWRMAALADGDPLEPLIYKAEGGYDEGAKRPNREDLRHVRCCWANPERSREVFSLAQALKRNVLTGLAIQTLVLQAPRTCFRERVREAPTLGRTA